MNTLTPQQDTSIDHEKIVHKLYEAVIDNSLWPEMVSEIIEYIEKNQDSQQVDTKQISGLSQHFERAFQLSECIVNLQEQNSTLNGVLDSLSIGVMLYDHNEQLIYSNQFATQHGLSFQSLEILKRQSDKMGIEHTRITDKQENLHQSLSIFENGQRPSEGIAVIPTKHIKHMNLPKSVSTLVLYSPKQSQGTLDYLKRTYFLTESESLFLNAFYQVRNLKIAAQDRGLTYESARTYLKRLFLKMGVSDQSALFSLIDNNPLSLIQVSDESLDDPHQVRRVLVLDDQTVMEYFYLGPEEGNVVFHFDALTGVALDLLGNPSVYLPLLHELNLRIVTPCRPGTFHSDMKQLKGLSDWTTDLEQLCSHLGATRVTLLSQAFGSCSALAFAASAPHLVEKVIMCAPHYPMYEPANWRQMDLFYIISNVIGKRTPKLMQVIIPFLMRSVMQNPKKYLNRHIAKSYCQADIDVLSNPILQTRITSALGERTLQGTEGLVQENYLNICGWDFQLEDIHCPVYLLQGGKDNLSAPEAAKQLAELLPNVKMALFDELGQYLIFSQWPWILELCAGITSRELEKELTQVGC